MKFISIGYGNIVAADRVVALVSPDSAPIKRLVQDAREEGRVIDVSCGRRTRAVIIGFRPCDTFRRAGGDDSQSP